MALKFTVKYFLFFYGRVTTGGEPLRLCGFANVKRSVDDFRSQIEIINCFCLATKL